MIQASLSLSSYLDPHEVKQSMEGTNLNFIFPLSFISTWYSASLPDICLPVYRLFSEADTVEGFLNLEWIIEYLH